MSDYDFESWTAEELSRIQTGTNLKCPSDHQSMFKYVGLNSDASWGYLRRTLNNSELIGSAALSLNDPFELSPVIFDDLQASTIAAAVKYNRFSPLSDKEPTPLRDVFPDPEPYRQQARSFLDSVASQYRIIAFCERSDSGLLWSHYANSYQGACLHFLAKGFRWKRHYTLGYVSYSKYRPTYPLSLALSLSPPPVGPPIPVNATPLRRAESEKILFFTKAEDWSYPPGARSGVLAQGRCRLIGALREPQTRQPRGQATSAPACRGAGWRDQPDDGDPKSLVRLRRPLPGRRSPGLPNPR